jgi:hypothetical protein
MKRFTCSLLILIFILAAGPVWAAPPAGLDFKQSTVKSIALAEPQFTFTVPVHVTNIPRDYSLAVCAKVYDAQWGHGVHNSVAIKPPPGNNKTWDCNDNVVITVNVPPPGKPQDYALYQVMIYAVEANGTENSIGSGLGWLDLTKPIQDYRNGTIPK